MYERGKQGGTIYLSNRPHFLWVYRRDDPRGMLGENTRKACKSRAEPVNP